MKEEPDFSDWVEDLLHEAKQLLLLAACLGAIAAVGWLAWGIGGA
jgi:hypothetical protein